MLNTIAAEELRQFADELEGSAHLEADVRKLVRRVMQEHKRIIFNGDGYSQAWVEEARRRGLLDLPTTVDCLPRYLTRRTSSSSSPTRSTPRRRWRPGTRPSWRST